ncbi:pyridoxamine 5'-phosphate oxidase family protein [Aquihabitans sp. G128]|uniref:pyridoxamine 5'-phosphate oxidase family protein n=1 Tax=Aquihabitans sp. G128 TaxID=2849779 RepID=UPI001C23147D|nr:pyridoxamine 5'-phosphate oxidase family protein [Aquihabitans sp. G128]QXC62594.1 pyridoxamine 5'-phosphate oxidase family protein [Aquihabitans sp. G128]
MTSWQQFSTEAPDLAERARAILSSTTNAVLGTIRADGSPRLSGIDPFFLGGELWIGSMPDARKGADLRRDPRVALHGIPWESRKVRDGAEDPGDGDVKVAGRAVLLADEARHAEVMAWFRDERGFEPPGPSDLFEIDLESVVVISVADDLLQVDRWAATDGRSTVRRS